MSRYRGPRFKKIRRLGTLPGLSTKSVHDLSEKKQPPPWKKSLYCTRLQEKQKLRFHYGLTERQLLKYVRIAGKAKGETGQVLLQLLEMRLDNILFRLGMAPTLPGARQLVNHKHILVNGRIVNIPSYRCKPRDTIEARDDQKSRALIQKNLAAREKDLRAKAKKYFHKNMRIQKRIEKEIKIDKKRKEVPGHLTIQPLQYKGLVKRIIDRESVGLTINELLVVEYYSRQI